VVCFWMYNSILEFVIFPLSVGKMQSDCSGEPSSGMALFQHMSAQRQNFGFKAPFTINGWLRISSWAQGPLQVDQQKLWVLLECLWALMFLRCCHFVWGPFRPHVPVSAAAGYWQEAD